MVATRDAISFAARYAPWQARTRASSVDIAAGDFNEKPPQIVRNAHADVAGSVRTVRGLCVRAARRASAFVGATPSNIADCYPSMKPSLPQRGSRALNASPPRNIGSSIVSQSPWPLRNDPEGWWRHWSRAGSLKVRPGRNRILATDRARGGTVLFRYGAAVRGERNRVMATESAVSRGRSQFSRHQAWPDAGRLSIGS